MKKTNEETKSVEVVKERKPLLNDKQKAEAKGYVRTFLKGAVFTLGGIAVTLAIGLILGTAGGGDHSDIIDE